MITCFYSLFIPNMVCLDLGESWLCEQYMAWGNAQGLGHKQPLVHSGLGLCVTQTFWWICLKVPSTKKASLVYNQTPN